MVRAIVYLIHLQTSKKIDAVNLICDCITVDSNIVLYFVGMVKQYFCNSIAQSNLGTGYVTTPSHVPPQTTAPTLHGLSHSYAAHSPLVTLACPTFTSKITPSRGPISKSNYIPGPIRPNIPKLHPYPIGHFATMHRTNRHTHRPTDGRRECLMTIGRFCSMKSSGINILSLFRPQKSS